MISILILTRNEETSLPDCLASVAWSNDVVVLDSCSTDCTRAVAEAASARVEQHAFQDYADQRNVGLRLGFKNDWVLMLDADERVPPVLRDEILTVTAQPDHQYSLYRVRRKDMFLGRWLRYSSGYPTWFGRMVRPERVQFERAINEKAVATGKIGYLREHIWHYPFNKGMDRWYERHNQYSTMEAELTQKELMTRRIWGKLFSRDPFLRRWSQKRFLYSLPMRPPIVFWYLYLARLGFLDGHAGYVFCRLRYQYEWMITLKVKENRRRNLQLPM